MFKFLIISFLFFIFIDYLYCPTANASEFINFYTDSYLDTFSYSKESIEVIPDGKVKISAVEGIGFLNSTETSYRRALNISDYLHN